ncbi:MAG: rhodanese-like domain-containing protein [Myxococcaceae bacterium]|nr:rhodanese-like domain-containing protein [Myxococcaceae bacterium]
MAAALAVTVGVPSLALACEHEQKAESSVKKVTLAELTTLQKDKKVSVYDANGNDTRKQFGVIPGATLLTSASTYDVKELNADKSTKLVFYCASEKCTSAKQAATRAIEAGYSDVSVFPDGIKGWAKAGQKTTPVPNS